MALYAIGDLHLSFSSNKPMDVFGNGWEGYTDKLAAGFGKLTGEDTTVLCGDTSWGITLDEAREDFLFIDALPGQKIILKGNHDFWWTSVTKMTRYLDSIGVSMIRFMHNNCYFCEGTALCGTRGWFFEEDIKGTNDEKIFKRELIRLEASLASAGGKEAVCFLRYPPCYQGYCCREIISIMKTYNIRRCYYGHIHGSAHGYAMRGLHDGIDYHLVSSDYTGFRPVRVL